MLIASSRICRKRISVCKWEKCSLLSLLAAALFWCTHPLFMCMYRICVHGKLIMLRSRGALESERYHTPPLPLPSARIKHRRTRVRWKWHSDWITPRRGPTCGVPLLSHSDSFGLSTHGFFESEMARVEECCRLILQIFPKSPHGNPISIVNIFGDEKLREEPCFIGLWPPQTPSIREREGNWGRSKRKDS